MRRRSLSGTTYLIYNPTEGLFWHNGTVDENERFLGWGCPATASRFSVYAAAPMVKGVYYPHTFGPGTRFVSEDSEIVRNWVDPEEGW